MQTIDYLQAYHLFKEESLHTRFIKYSSISALLKKLPPSFEQKILGKSFEDRDITLVTWGNGPIRIFLWSQMHGDEPTGTMALFDLLNFLQHPYFINITKELAAKCTLYILPMVNPDGAERFTRRNAQQIDINRDFNQTATPEGMILKNAHQQITPHFGFNLHDQSNLWSVKKTRKPALLSFLAPAFDEALNLSEGRKKAMLVIAHIYDNITQHLPQQIGLFDDEHEPRAFGDNFQASGTSTILIEAGGYENAEELQEVRKYYFLSILSALKAIVQEKHLLKSLKDYQAIPKNNKEIFHILIKNLAYRNTTVSMGINYEEEPSPCGTATERRYMVKDIGDLNHLGAYHVFDDTSFVLEGEIEMEKTANFIIKQGKMKILSFKNGFLQSKL